MKVSLGKFQVNGSAKDSIGDTKHLNVVFEGMQYEVSIAELIELATKRFDLFWAWLHEFLKIQDTLRSEMKKWHTAVNELEEAEFAHNDMMRMAKEGAKVGEEVNVEEQQEQQ